MSYYDKRSDRNREAKRNGERDAERGWRSSRSDYDPHTERGAAYDDGYREERRHIERKEEERQEQERHEQEVCRRQLEDARMRQQEEEDYYFEREQQNLQDQEQEPLCEPQREHEAK